MVIHLWRIKEENTGKDEIVSTNYFPKGFDAQSIIGSKIIGAVKGWKKTDAEMDMAGKLTSGTVIAYMGVANRERAVEFYQEQYRKARERFFYAKDDTEEETRALDAMYNAYVLLKTIGGLIIARKVLYDNIP